jgi:DNA-binding transcriptional ArsR family regulator
MVAAANMVEVAALVGDTARATMLAALMGGQSRTGTELAFLARVSRSTASEHLTKLVDAKLLAVTSKRRFHYYRIASPLVAAMLESIKAVAAIEVPPRHQPRSTKEDAVRFRAQLLRPPGRSTRRRDSGRAHRQRPSGACRGWRRGHREGPEIPVRLRREPDIDVGKQTNFLPRLSRLERAALSRRWLGRLATVAAVL